MQISFYSLLMAALWSSVLILFLSLLRIWEEGKISYNAAPLTVLLVACVFRCLFPLDFPGFTIPIPSTGLYAEIDEFLETPIVKGAAPGESIKPLTIFVIVWIVGFLVGILWQSLKYWLDMKKVDNASPTTVAMAYEVGEAICEEWGIKHLTIIRTTGVEIPHACGLLYPRVLLPDVDYTEREYRIILMHELTHWRNRDMVVKALSRLICCAFWWNPFVYLLLFRLEETLEFKCDATVLLYLNDEERKLYAGIVNKALHDVEDNRKKQKKEELHAPLGSELRRRGTSRRTMKRRTDIIMHHKPDKKKERRLTVFTAAILTVVLIFSYRYIIQPYFYVPKDEFSQAGGALLSSNNTYLVKDQNGMYSMYVDGQLYMSFTEENVQAIIDSGIEIREE